MPSDSIERSLTTKANQVGAPPPPDQHEPLPCPRCDSTNTKFCYYNNYNFSQPRHFCKTCRRYWTHGGTLRDIPVGGGSRKNAKRCRTTVTPVTYVAPDNRHIISNSANPVLVHHGEPVGPFSGEAKPSLNMFGSFTSLLNTPSPGLFSLGGLGLGIGSGFDDTELGFGRAFWPFEDNGAVGRGTGGGGGASMIGNPWQLETGEGGFVGGDCFPLPGFAISTPGNTMK